MFIFPSAKKISLWVFIPVTLLLLGCSDNTMTHSNRSTPYSPVSTPINVLPTPQGQELPITAKFTLGEESIELEVAKTPEQQEMGLMYRTILPPNRGMLFSFSPPRRVAFWMKNTLIPLDMVFLKEGKIMAILKDVPPCTTPTCPVYNPQVMTDSVIELSAGRAQSLNLQIGDKINITSVGE